MKHINVQYPIVYDIPANHEIIKEFHSYTLIQMKLKRLFTSFLYQ
jgi:hypothetical protein